MTYTIRFCLDTSDSEWQQHVKIDTYGLDEDRLTWYYNELANVALNSNFSYEVIDDTTRAMQACHYLPRHKRNTCSYGCGHPSHITICEECTDDRRHINGETRCSGTLKEENPVSHPKHYTSHPSGIECIEITRHMSFNLGNAIKYLWRADEKDAPIQDLEKAAWYIQDEITKRKNNESTA